MTILLRDKQKFNKEVTNSALLDEITDNPLDQEKLRLELDGNLLTIEVIPGKNWKFSWVVFKNIHLRDIIEDNGIEKIMVKCEYPVEVRLQTDLDYYNYEKFNMVYEGPKRLMVFSKTDKLFKF